MPVMLTLKLLPLGHNLKKKSADTEKHGFYCIFRDSLLNLAWNTLFTEHFKEDEEDCENVVSYF